jgi:hypothetical protein
MYLGEKISRRLKCVYLGIAMGLLIWLMYASYVVFTYAINDHVPIASAELVLTPLEK